MLELVEGFVASIYGEKSVFDFFIGGDQKLLVAIKRVPGKIRQSSLEVLFIYALLVYSGLFIKTIL
ncbi:hypothetical protein [Leptothermofonsia sp. ETS-13]|uniref:hypothetical protein n=1 Tax=Leptothermofonsia sp. ETS-13 TaxID=3035696 RepID=UPI003B9F3298